MDLRPYQSEAVENLRQSVAQGARAPVLVAPCGSGKTILAKAIIENAVSKGRKALFLAPRRELIYQTIDKVEAAGIHAGIIMAGESTDMLAPVQVACVPTLYRRVERALPPPADLILVDECHLSISKMTQTILDQYPNAVKIGLTATPCRADGKGLGEVYDDLVMGPTVPELTEQGYLVPVEYYAPTKPDLEGVKVQMGDYNQKELGHRMDDPVLIGDVVTNWLRIAPDRQTVVFGVNVAHSVHLRDCFRDAGIRAEHIDAKTPNDERRDILRRVEDGDVQIICNCDVLSYGWDSPAISCGVLARPTKSLARYLQAAGRILRPYPHKHDTILIDHSGVIDELGFIEDEHPWTLDGKASVHREQAERKSKEPKPLTCPHCSTVFKNAGICPCCGHNMHKERAEAIAAVDAELARVDREKKEAMKREWTGAEKEQFYQELLGVARQRGYKDGWAFFKYQERLGVKPSWAKVAREPSPETLSWVKSRMIAWAKKKEKEAKRAA